MELQLGARRGGPPAPLVHPNSNWRTSKRPEELCQHGEDPFIIRWRTTASRARFCVGQRTCTERHAGFDAKIITPPGHALQTSCQRLGPAGSCDYADRFHTSVFISASCNLQLGKLDWIDSRSQNEPFWTAKRKSTFQQKVTNKTKNKNNKTKNAK